VKPKRKKKRDWYAIPGETRAERLARIDIILQVLCERMEDTRGMTMTEIARQVGVDRQVIIRASDSGLAKIKADPAKMELLQNYLKAQLAIAPSITRTTGILDEQHKPKFGDHYGPEAY